MRARSSTDVPFEETVTVWPLRIPRALRVVGVRAGSPRRAAGTPARACARRRRRRRAAGRRRAADRRRCATGARVRGCGARRRGARRQRRALADVAERDAAEAGRGDSSKRTETCGETSTSKRSASFATTEHVRHRREHRAPLALEAALEVDGRAVALEVARARAGRGRRCRGSCPRTSRCRGRSPPRLPSHGRRVQRSLVARDDEQAGLVVAGLAVARRAPRVGDAAAVRRARQVDRRGSRRDGVPGRR